MATPEIDSDPAAVFVTVAEAVSLLGVSERTARRYAGQVPDTDRQTGGKGGTRYRLDALRRVAGLPDSATGNATATPDTAPVNAGHDATGLVAELRARLADKESETTFLRAALLSEQEAVKAAQANVHALAGELAKSREQSAVMIAATAGAFTTFADPGDRSNGLQIAAGGADSPASGEPVETPSAADSGFPLQKSAGRPWWQFLKGNG